MSGFRTAPVIKKTENQEYKEQLVNKLIVKNISLFSKYNFNPEINSIILTGVDNINNSYYSGDIFHRIKGFVEYRDIGPTDSFGVLNASGYTTGKLLNNQNFVDSKNRKITPIEDYYIIKQNAARYKPRASLLESGNLLNRTDLKPEEFNEFSKNEDVTLPPFSLYRENLYTGKYSGIQTITENFYDPESYKVNFFKNVSYVVVGGSGWETSELVVSREAKSLGEVPGINILNKILLEGSGYIHKSGYENVVGYIPSVGILRKNVSGFNYITGKLTGFVDYINSGVFIFDQIITGYKLIGKQNQATGYINSFNYLSYNNPVELDSITIQNSNRDTIKTLIYSPETFFNPPDYFKNITELHNIINSGKDEYGIASELDLPNNRLKLSAALDSGTLGDNISITTFGGETRPILQTGETLFSGQNFYPNMYFTGLLTGYIFEQVLATGYMLENYSDIITGNVSGIVGYRTFNQESGRIWNILVSDDNISYLALNSPNRKSLTGIRFTGDFIDDPTVNSYNVRIGYNNQGFLEKDVAQLKIGLNDVIYKYIDITGNSI